MDGNVKLLIMLLSYVILMWAIYSNSIASAIVGIGLLFFIALDDEEWVKEGGKNEKQKN